MKFSRLVFAVALITSQQASADAPRPLPNRVSALADPKDFALAPEVNSPPRS
jgi:hypothetical protein